MSNDFTARYYRGGQLHERPQPTIDDAINFLTAGADQGWCAPVDVTRSDGTIALGPAETMRRIHAKQEEWDGEPI
jgi:hypothetical protein